MELTRKNKMKKQIRASRLRIAVPSLRLRAVVREQKDEMPKKCVSELRSLFQSDLQSHIKSQQLNFYADRADDIKSKARAIFYGASNAA